MPANGQPKRPNYPAKSAETVAAGKDVRVRLFTLAAGRSFLGIRTAKSRRVFRMGSTCATVAQKIIDSEAVLALQRSSRANVQMQGRGAIVTHPPSVFRGVGGRCMPPK